MLLKVALVISFLGCCMAVTPDYYPMEVPEQMPEDQTCRSGYYWDYGGQDGCCSYHQCDSDAIMFGYPVGNAFKRWCWEPLMWNNETCTCDFQINNPVLECRDGSTILGCWGPLTDHKPRPPCKVDDPETQCCQIGEEEGADEGLGFLFTKLNETEYIFCVDTESQSCPEGTFFDLETCCCTLKECDCAAYVWNFQEPSFWQAKKDEFTNDTCGAIFRTKTCTEEINFVACPNSGSVMKTDLFIKILLDQDYAFGIEIVNVGDGVLFDNWEDEAISKNVGTRVKATLTDDGSVLTVQIGDESVVISSIIAPSAPNQYLHILFDSLDKITTNVFVYSDLLNLLGQGTMPYTPVKGTGSPLSVFGEANIGGVLIVPSIKAFNALVADGKATSGPKFDLINSQP